MDFRCSVVLGEAQSYRERRCRYPYSREELVRGIRVREDRRGARNGCAGGFETGYYDDGHEGPRRQRVCGCGMENQTSIVGDRGRRGGLKLELETIVDDDEDDEAAESTRALRYLTLGTLGR